MSLVGNVDFGYIPSLALFDKPSVNSGVVAHKWIEIGPVSQVTNSGTVEFNIPGTSSDYINLSCCLLEIRGKIVDKEGNAIAQNDAALVNLPLHSMWKQVDIAFQQRRANASVGTNYAYKAYIDTLLNSTDLQQTGQLSSQVFGLDDAGSMDACGSANTGFVLREEYTTKSAIVQMKGPLFLDLCQQDRYILNGVSVNIKLYPNNAEFFIASSKEKGF